MIGIMGGPVPLTGPWIPRQSHCQRVRATQDLPGLQPLAWAMASQASLLSFPAAPCAMSPSRSRPMAVATGTARLRQDCGHECIVVKMRMIVAGVHQNTGAALAAIAHPPPSSTPATFPFPPGARLRQGARGHLRGVVHALVRLGVAAALKGGGRAAEGLGHGVRLALGGPPPHLLRVPRLDRGDGVGVGHAVGLHPRLDGPDVHAFAQVENCVGGEATEAWGPRINRAGPWACTTQGGTLL